ncbi:isopenicillin-N epimerase [Sphaerisporangium melleum]|uniref:Isopenicillin-N epimerase n=1 Tax=Sphaerisporangium melleum TaxID=321316 RepID=A0A917R7S8_9ACTN|nr:aminotransferase class V-fold PLP-dependent enzyme [Sphaerisporangium melleum]GGK94466.1 isopenicillin-N epimerase [Sphaerisporangium melleum]GII73247.1 isopenicillin-N epimerase [Sphaerisporangium melleum]
MTWSRREVVAGLGALAVAPAASSGRPLADLLPAVPAGVTPERLAGDEEFWAGVAALFRVSPAFVNLENGYYGVMPEPVRQAYHRNVDLLNERNSHLLRTAYKARADRIRQRVARVVGASAAEIALTRGGTEALQNLIAGYNRLRPGDAVMYADLDYHSGQYAMNWLAGRRGVRVERIVIPEPATRQAVLDTYERALGERPGVRLLLLSHLNNRTGLVAPVREICVMARHRGVDVIVDAAHSFGQLEFTVDDLDADFAVFSLHKWMGAPLGSGFLYIRAHRLADIAPVFADETYPAGDIRSRVHSGTMDVAPILTVGTALDFHEALGGANKQARLRYLRDRWVHRVRDVPGMQILTPDEPGMYGAITAFRLAGRTRTEENVAITDHLMNRHRIFTVQRGGVTAGDCVRVTPALFTTAEHLDRLAAALRTLPRALR